MPSLRKEEARECLSRKINVLCEKPLATNSQDGRRICRQAEESEVLLMTGFRHRFLPANIGIKNLIEEGRLGAIIFFRNNFTGFFPEVEKTWFSDKEVGKWSFDGHFSSFG